MNKPIEPGCLVMTIHPSFFGFNATALRYLPVGEVYQGIDITKPVWEVSDAPSSDLAPICEQKYLIRIDGGDPDASLEQDQDEEVPSHAHV